MKNDIFQKNERVVLTCYICNKSVELTKEESITYLMNWWRGYKAICCGSEMLFVPCSDFELRV
jgi:hypothetical protein